MTKTKKKNPQQIDALELIPINGLLQYITIRSENVANPLILYFHGGPGLSELPMMRQFSHELERNFTVVYWEQRGTGKSFSRRIPEHTYNIGQFINDGYMLTKYLMNRFSKKKIYIIGHSWGTIIGTRLALSFPQLYYAYISIGQIVNPNQAEKISFFYTLNKAIKDRNRKAIRELRNADEPPFLTITNNPKWYRQLKTQRKWLLRFRGLVYRHSFYLKLVNSFWYSNEYSLLDMFRLIRSSSYMVKKMWPEIMKVNFFDEPGNFAMPVYFVQGIYDFNSPTELVKEYHNYITAPDKDFFLFENSAHAPNYEESYRFNRLVEFLITNVEQAMDDEGRYLVFAKEHKVQYED